MVQTGHPPLPLTHSRPLPLLQVLRHSDQVLAPPAALRERRTRTRPRARVHQVHGPGPTEARDGEDPRLGLADGVPPAEWRALHRGRLHALKSSLARTSDSHPGSPLPCPLQPRWLAGTSAALPRQRRAADPGLIRSPGRGPEGPTARGRSGLPSPSPDSPEGCVLPASLRTPDTGHPYREIGRCPVF